MVKFSSEGSSIKATVDLGNIGYNFEFSANRYCQMDAILLRNQMQKEFSAMLEKIRKDAYNAGWKDAKGKKKPKRTYFPNWVDAKMLD